MELTANILRIERISLSDGEGMRTVIFFKGCPLQCAWCSTPESQKAAPEMYYKKERCKACGKCIIACPEHALTFDLASRTVIRDHTKCTACGKCKEACPYQAQLMYGKVMTVKQVVREILKDELFYWHSGGGVTFSGGEALLYPDFVREVIMECKEVAINTAAELAMNVPFENVQKVVPYLDFFYVDVKSMDPAVHKRWTGVDNAQILDNIRKASDICRPGAIHIRTPLIWDINDDRESVRRIAEFCASLKNCSELELLPYHRLGTHAYEELNRPYPLAGLNSMSEDTAKEKAGELLNRKWPFDIRAAGHLIYKAAAGAQYYKEAANDNFRIVKGCY